MSSRVQPCLWDDGWMKSFHIPLEIIKQSWLSTDSVELRPWSGAWTGPLFWGYLATPFPIGLLILTRQNASCCTNIPSLWKFIVHGDPATVTNTCYRLYWCIFNRRLCFEGHVKSKFFCSSAWKRSIQATKILDFKTLSSLWRVSSLKESQAEMCVPP